jgi:hypothetical protein
MGSSTDAHCYSCGYDVFLMLGGGMANHTTFAAWPVTCENCNGVTTANFKLFPLACLKCGSITFYRSMMLGSGRAMASPRSNRVN